MAKYPRLREVILLSVGVLCVAGCARSKYRHQADQDAYHTIAATTCDPRWQQRDFSIEMDPRSRYYVPENVDHPPMPADDPASNKFMQCIWGMKGYQHWLDDGVTHQFENPTWREQLGDYVPLTEDGKIILDVDTALKLAYIHSPDYQGQIEELYLTAIDVSTERFRFETQYNGGVEAIYNHLGRDRPGGELNTLNVDSDLTASRQFATAGTLLVGLANQLTWQFAGPDTHSNLSILNFALAQPLLRGGGRAIALERLTRTQRAMLANLRNFQLFRQGFYTGVSIGGGGGFVRRPGGGFGGTGLTAFTGSGAGGEGGIAGAAGFGFFGGGGGDGGGATAGGLAGGGAGTVGGFIGLLQRGQTIRNDEYSLSLQQRTLTLLEANLRAGLIDLTQVDNFRQSIQTLIATLAQSKTAYQDQLDGYKQESLGLPPDVELELDDSFIKQFELIDRSVVELQDQLAEFQARIGALPLQPDDSILEAVFQEAVRLLEEARQLNEVAAQDMQKMNGLAEDRTRHLGASDKARFDRDRAALTTEFEKFPAQFEEIAGHLHVLQSAVSSEVDMDQIVNGLVAFNRNLGNHVQSVSLAQARARLESVVLEPVRIGVDRAIETARTYRYDYMNNRAGLVDSWRLIEFNANSLQSVLDVRVDGDVFTTGDNPIKFQAPNGSLRASLEWDAPLTRVIERNNYRQQLIQYARDRRRFVRTDDGLVASLRSRLRWMDQLYDNLEIQRQAVVIAIRRVEFTQSQLSAPLPVPVPGAPPPSFGPTAVQNLLQALADLSNAQNNFMSVWLQYYSNRMQLMQSLGLMELDENGRWIDRPLDEVLVEIDQGMHDGCEPWLMPPAIPRQYWHLSDPRLDARPAEALPSTQVLPPETPRNPQPAETLPPPRRTQREDELPLQPPKRRWTTARLDW